MSRSAVVKNTVYRVEWSKLAIGKTIASSKRRLVWKFGFANPEALANGFTGADCRGEEHEIVVVYSLTTGKRLVWFDNHEVYYTTGRSMQEGKFEHTWTTKGGHTIQIIAYFSMPYGRRQFEMIFNGMSFFSMPHIFELGTSLAEERMERLLGVDPVLPDESLFAAAELKRYERVTGKHELKIDDAPTLVSDSPQPIPASDQDKVVDLLLDFSSSSVYLTQDFIGDVLPAASEHQDVHFTQLYDSYQSSSNGFVSSNNMAYDVPTNNPFFTNIYTDTHELGDTPPSSVALTASFPPNSQNELPYLVPQPVVHSSSGQECYPINNVHCKVDGQRELDSFSAIPVSPISTVHVPNMACLSVTDLGDDTGAEINEIGLAVKNLVNLDDITGSAETPEQRKYREQRDLNNSRKSKPLPPAAYYCQVGVNAKLDDIKTGATRVHAPSDEVMRSHGFDQNSGHASILPVRHTQVSQTIPAFSGIHFTNHYQQPQQYHQ